MEYLCRLTLLPRFLRLFVLQPLAFLPSLVMESSQRTLLTSNILPSLVMASSHCFPFAPFYVQGLLDAVSLPGVVWLSDLDWMVHMNNARVRSWVPLVLTFSFNPLPASKATLHLLLSFSFLFILAII